MYSNCIHRNLDEDKMDSGSEIDLQLKKRSQDSYGHCEL